MVLLWDIFDPPPNPPSQGGFQTPPTPEQIASLLSLGGVIAYLIGGVIFSRWSRSLVLALGALLAIVAFWGGYFAASWIIFALAVTVIGATYGMWSIARNTLVSIEIAHGRQDVIVSGAVTILLIVFLVVGTVIGSRLSGSSDLWLIGGGVLSGVLLLSLFPLLGLRSESRNEGQSWWQGISGMWRVFRRYWRLIIAVSLYWAISTEASNVALVSATELFHQTQAEASYLLLYSSVGAVIGNIVSMSLARYRAGAFLVISTLFLLLVGGMGWVFQFSAQSGISFMLPVISGLLGFLFGAGVNFIESSYFAFLGSDPDREYGSSMYGLILSICLFLLMSVAHVIRADLGLVAVSVFLALMMLLVLYGGVMGIRKK